MSYFVHPQGLCESLQVGEGTRIWAFAHVLQGARIGRDCNICDHVFIEGDVTLGDRVTVKCGVQLWNGTVIEDDVFLGPNATFTNDRFPRSKRHLVEFPRMMVRQGASIGANATILPGLEVGGRAMVGAGAVVTHNVPPNAIVIGNPARIVGYVDTEMHKSGELRLQYGGSAVEVALKSMPHGVKLVELPEFDDMRGNLVVGEFPTGLPFVVRRYFTVFGVKSARIRGEHAHRKCHQFLVCVAGHCSVVADDGSSRHEFLLDSPRLGLYLPPMVWGIQYKYSPDAVLVVFASDPYDAADYIRNYAEFLALRNESR